MLRKIRKIMLNNYIIKKHVNIKKKIKLRHWIPKYHDKKKRPDLFVRPPLKMKKNFYFLYSTFKFNSFSLLIKWAILVSFNICNMAFLTSTNVSRMPQACSWVHSSHER